MNNSNEQFEQRKDEIKRNRRERQREKAERKAPKHQEKANKFVTKKSKTLNWLKSEGTIVLEMIYSFEAKLKADTAGLESLYTTHEKDQKLAEMYEGVRESIITKFNNIALVATLFLTMTVPIVTSTFPGPDDVFITNDKFNWEPFNTFVFGFASSICGVMAILWSIRVVSKVHSYVYNLDSLKLFLSDPKFLYIPELLQFWSMISGLLCVGFASLKLLQSVGGSDTESVQYKGIKNGLMWTSFILLILAWIVLCYVERISRYHMQKYTLDELDASQLITNRRTVIKENKMTEKMELYVVDAQRMQEKEEREKEKKNIERAQQQELIRNLAKEEKLRKEQEELHALEDSEFNIDNSQIDDEIQTYQVHPDFQQPMQVQPHTQPPQYYSQLSQQPQVIPPMQQERS
eukprot:Pgem_evm1s5148